LKIFTTGKKSAVQRHAFISMVLPLFLLFSPVNLSAQNRIAPYYEVKAAFLYNFTRFIEWPESSFNSPEDPFIIGVIGKNPFGNFLEDIVANEHVKGHQIKVVYFQSIKEISTCHLLYINVSEPDKIKTILDKISEENTLTVSDATNFAKWGGHIRFFTESDKIRLQINLEKTKEAKLSISSKLLGIAQIY